MRTCILILVCLMISLMIADSFSTSITSTKTISTKLYMGVTLYGAQQTRSPLVNWYLIENKIPFIQKPPRPSNHPFGQSPYLTDDDGVEIFESGFFVNFPITITITITIAITIPITITIIITTTITITISIPITYYNYNSN